MSESITVITKYLGISPDEIRPVSDFPGYFITSNGLIVSTKGKGLRVLKPWATNDGHLVTGLSRNGKRKRVYLHQTVLEQFSGERPSQSHVARHLDGNRINNSISNLEWSTHLQNCADRKLHGTNHGRKIISDEVRLIRELTTNPGGLISETFSYELLGRMLGLSH